MHRKLNGSKLVYVDGGSNRGQTYTKQRYKQQPDRYYAFDPDPRQLKYASEYTKNPEVTFFNSALSDRTGPTPFGLCDRDDEQAGSVYDNKWREFTTLIQEIDIKAWCESWLNPEDYNVLKLDVEGSEYKVLKYLMTGNTLKYYFNELEVEWHSPRHFPVLNKEYCNEIINHTLRYCEHYNIAFTELH